MSKKMKIGLVLSRAPAYSETFIINKIDGLIKSGKHVILFLNYYEKHKEFDDKISFFYQINLNRKLYIFFKLIKVLITCPLIICKFLYLERASNLDWYQILKRLIINLHIIDKKIDWLHFTYATMGLGRENVAKAIGAKSAVSFRGFDIGLYPHKNIKCYNLLWKRIDKVHSISDALYNKALKLGLSKSIKYKKIYPAINLELFNNKNKKIQISKPLHILTVSRLSWKKGLEYALKAISLLKESKIDFQYNIIGEGEYKESILYAIHQLKLGDNVILNGNLSQFEIVKFMEKSDVYLQPSIQEGFCNAVLEAQVMGLLCIVSDADGLSENVIDKKTGWVVPRRSSEAIYNKLKKVLVMKDSDILKIKSNAIERVREKFNILYQRKLFNEFY